MIERHFILDGIDPVGFYGAGNIHLQMLKRLHPKLRIVARDNIIKAMGDDDELEKFNKVIELLKDYCNKYNSLNEEAIIDAVNGKKGDKGSDSNVIVYNINGRPIYPRTENQCRLVEEYRKNDMLFAVGPAGTGKTFLAVAEAVAEFKRGEIERIIMSRPAIEAGEERLGFLPGDLAQKVDPYLRPLYDALNDILGAEQAKRMQEKGIIEIAPLAYMRGRTLSNARIIIDESQNASLQTLKMALTRLGEGSKMVLTGDVTQIDLPKATTSGLEKVAAILKTVEDVSVIRLNNQDVVRNKIVRDIIKAFEKDEARQREKDAQLAKRKKFS